MEQIDFDAKLLLGKSISDARKYLPKGMYIVTTQPNIAYNSVFMVNQVSVCLDDSGIITHASLG